MRRNSEIGSSSQHSERKEARDEQSHQTEADLTKRWWRASSQQEIESKEINISDSQKKIFDDISHELAKMQEFIEVSNFSNVLKKYRIKEIHSNIDKIKRYNEEKMKNALISIKEKTKMLSEAKKLFDSISNKQAKMKRIIDNIDSLDYLDKKSLIKRIDLDKQLISEIYNEVAIHYSIINDSKSYLTLYDDIEKSKNLIEMEKFEKLYKIIDLIDDIAYEQTKMQESTEMSDFPDPSKHSTRNQIASDEQSIKDLYGKFIQYYSIIREERSEKDKININSKKLKIGLNDIKEIKIYHQIIFLFDDIDKNLQNLRKISKMSNFFDFFKPRDIQQINSHAQKTNEWYKEFTQKKYREFLDSNIIESLKSIRCNIKNDMYSLFTIIDLNVNSLEDLKLKINNRYKQYMHNIKEIKIIPDIADKMERTLSSLKDFYGKFSRSCEQGDFLAAGKWTKEIILVYEKFGRYYAHAYFKSQFISEMKKLPLSLPEQKQLAEISRHTPVSDIPKEWQRAFVIAKGKTIAEKVNSISGEFIASNRTFNDRYYSKVKSKFNKDTKKYEEGEFLVKTYKKGKRHNLYTNSIDINKYEIKAMHNFRDQDVKYAGNALPNSEILHNQLLLVLKEQKTDPPCFPLQRVIREAVTNQETRDTLRFFAPQCDDHSEEESMRRFEKGSNEYYSMLGTPNVYGILYLLKQHQDIFGKREINSIEVDYDKCNIILHINEVIDDRASEIEPD